MADKVTPIAETLTRIKVRQNKVLFIFEHGRYIDSGNEYYSISRRNGQDDWTRWEFDEVTWSKKLSKMTDILN